MTPATLDTARFGQPTGIASMPFTGVAAAPQFPILQTHGNASGFAPLLYSFSSSSGADLFTAQAAEMDCKNTLHLIDGADVSSLRAMAQDLVLAIRESCRDRRWTRVAQLALDWVATLEVAAEDQDGHILLAREEMRRGEGVSWAEFLHESAT